jgi:two-component system phosphate regulon sensor histidine kinase PhoR
VKKDSFIIALSCALFITVILYVLSFVFPSLVSLTSGILIALFGICFGAIYSVYYIVVGQKLRKITNILARESTLENPSLTSLEFEINKLLRERREELEKIEKLERHRREFLGNVSHEMKTPLFHIQGYVSTLAENNIDDPALSQRYLERTEHSVDRLIRILEDLDTISQLETKELTGDFEPFDVVDLGREVMESEEIDAEKKNIKLSLKTDHDKLAVIGDRFRIRQVLLNLVVNSIRYGKQDGETQIRIKNGGDTVLIEVADTGIGIGPEHLSRLFERFYRVDKGRSREQGGTGLGLSIVKHILEAHHQTIQVTSTPGVGSVFSFHLKKAPHHSSFLTI